MKKITITQEVADMATEAAVDALIEFFVPALLRAGVTISQIKAAFNDSEAIETAKRLDNA